MSTEYFQPLLATYQMAMKKEIYIYKKKTESDKKSWINFLKKV